MNVECFASDYAYLPTERDLNRLVSNPSELFRSEALQGLLRLCGMSEREINSSASDYELFAALCKAFSMLVGHPTYDALSTFWTASFPSLELPNEQNVMLLWREMTDLLMESPRRLCDFFAKPTRVLTAPDELARVVDGFEPMLCVNCLLQCESADFESWQNAVYSCFAAFYEKGSKQMLIRLDADYHYIRPDPYHVSVALKESNDNSANRSLMISQLFRMMCEFSLKRDMQILLYADCDAVSLRELLSYAERSVGLPRLYWASRNPAVADAVLRWQELPHQNSVYMALRLSHLPSREECAAVIRSAAARYPIGRLCFVTESDLVLMRAAQERIKHILDETLKKL